MDAYLEGMADGVAPVDGETFDVLRDQTARLGGLAEDVATVSQAEEHRLVEFSWATHPYKAVPLMPRPPARLGGFEPVPAAVCIHLRGAGRPHPTRSRAGRQRPTRNKAIRAYLTR